MANVGQMRHRIKIYEIGVTSPDGIAGSNTAKLLVKSCWAECEYQDGYRADMGSGVRNYARYQITARAGSYNITTTNIIEFESKEHTIESISKDIKNRYQILQTWVVA